MKKVVLLTTLLLLTGCKTQQELAEEKRLEELNKITEEVNKTEVPESTKDWLIKTKTEEVLTIICISTSSKCNTINTNLEELKKQTNIETYYIEVDKLTEEETNIYKTTFKLDDYNGYLPYMLLTRENELITTIKDTADINEIKNIIDQNKIVSE